MLGVYPLFVEPLAAMNGGKRKEYPLEESGKQHEIEVK